MKVQERAHPSDLLWELLGFDEDPRGVDARELEDNLLAIAAEVREEPEKVARAIEQRVRERRLERGECPECAVALRAETRVRETRYGSVTVEVDACPDCGFSMERE